MNKGLPGSPRLRVLSVPVATTIPVSISCAVCVILPVSVSLSLVVCVSLPSPFLASTAFASTIVVLPACAASRGGDLAIGRDNLARCSLGQSRPNAPVQRSLAGSLAVLNARHEDPPLRRFVPAKCSLVTSEHEGSVSKCPYAHLLREAPIRGDIRYRRAADGHSRRCVLAFVCAGGCRSRCSCFWIQPRVTM